MAQSAPSAVTDASRPAGRDTLLRLRRWFVSINSILKTQALLLEAIVSNSKGAPDLITQFRISNFKSLQSVELELGSATVFIGPNNSGKTTALQALALWDMGWRRWNEKRSGSNASTRQGVVINRRDLVAIPVPSPKLLWNMLRTQSSSKDGEGRQHTEKQFITLEAQGIHHDEPWQCALEFYYSNEESFYCRLKN